MSEDMKAALFATLFIAGGAVALILWQHGQHTQAIVQAVANPPGSLPVPVDPLAGGPLVAVSPAGTPTPGSIGIYVTPETAPLVTGRDWSLNGQTMFQ